MSHFIFFRKGTQISALRKGDADAAMRLKQQGYEQLFEEIEAADASSALARYNDIKKDEELNQYAFALGAPFSVIIVFVVGLMIYVAMQMMR